MALGNHSVKYRSSRAGKYVVAYLPVLKCPKSITSASERKKFGLEVSRIHMRCWKLIIDDLQDVRSRGGYYLDIHGQNYKQIVPSLLLIIGDHPESQKLCGCATSWRARRPCRVCNVTFKYQGFVGPKLRRPPGFVGPLPADTPLWPSSRTVAEHKV